MSQNFVLKYLIAFFKLDFFFNGLRKYSHFGGREGRKNFFQFQLAAILIFIGLNVILKKFDAYIYLLFYVLFMIPPVISSMVRRLHDVGKSGYVLPFSVLAGIVFFVLGVLFFNVSHFMLGLITILSFLIIIYPLFLFLKPSEKNKNKYDESVSHPIKHFLMLFSFVLIFGFFLYLFGFIMSNIDVLPPESPLTNEEIRQIDSLIKER